MPALSRLKGVEVPLINKSKYRTPAACSAEILLALVGPREVVSSNSIPGNRDLKLSVMLFLNSALAGIPATSLPSFLAASTVLSHSVCPVSFYFGCA